MTLKAYQNAMDEITKLRAELEAAKEQHNRDTYALINWNNAITELQEQLAAEKAQHEAWEQESLKQEGELRRELAAANAELSEWRSQAHQSQSGLERLEVEIERLKDDAERYRWLCAHLHDTDALGELYKHAGDVPTKEELDAAIDKARGEK